MPEAIGWAISLSVRGVFVCVYVCVGRHSQTTTQKIAEHIFAFDFKIVVSSHINAINVMNVVNGAQCATITFRSNRPNNKSMHFWQWHTKLTKSMRFRPRMGRLIIDTWKSKLISLAIYSNSMTHSHTHSAPLCDHISSNWFTEKIGCVWWMKWNETITFWLLALC